MASDGHRNGALRVVDWRQNGDSGRMTADAPTRAEIDALRAYLDSGSVRGAARLLGLNEQTVKNQLGTLRRRLGVDTTAQAVAVLGLRI